ncbi:MAG: hypothetical protein KKF30_18155 [Proteobacteria bacterium]|nr:hypothetical protein [Pseudomonadota bacterium]MBU4469830.1 hypothetical protein [Pseudomonadota bacterium]MCG2753065.1 hypothetical protein [Desulfobacteraceae bacterium]
MPDFILDEGIKNTFRPFMEEILSKAGSLVHSVYMTGSALTKNYDPKHSNINSILVLHQMDLKLLEWLAPLGKKYGKKRLAAPLIMTPAYIQKSLDVFPIEFLNIKLIHHRLLGDDLFENIEINLSDLRNQCEREVKVKLINLWQNYLSASGDRKVLTDDFIRSFSGYIPLFRGLILLKGRLPPILNEEVLVELERVTSVNTMVFKLVLKEKKERKTLSATELNTLFEDYHAAMDKLGDIVDAMEL